MQRQRCRIRNAAVVAALDAGVAPKLVAFRFGLSVSMVGRVAKAAGRSLHVRRSLKPLHQDIVAAFVQGEPRKIIAHRYGVTERWVRILARRSRMADGLVQTA